MPQHFTLLAFILALAFLQPLHAGATADLSEENEASDGRWKFSLEVLTYLAQHARDYANPVFSVDHDWLHLEARYNYESLKTGSLWLGWNLEAKKELEFKTLPALNGVVKFKFTPMVGGVFGDITGVAPGYSIEIEYQQIYFVTQGEYFVDAAIHAGDFFYSWSELRFYPVERFWAGMVVDRTKVLEEEFDVRRGPLIGYKFTIQKRDFDLTAYWLSPGSRNATFVFGVLHEF
jgi:hypothetical protein